MRDKPETNVEFITRVMEVGCPTGALIQPFILEALRMYCEELENFPVTQEQCGELIDAAAWNKTGAWLKEQIDNRA